MFAVLLARPLTILAFALASAAQLEVVSDGPALTAPPIAEQVVQSSAKAQPAEPEISDVVSLEDSFYEVSTRNIPQGAACGCGPFNYCVRRYDCGRGWTTTCVDEIVSSTDPRIVTVFWVHGYQYEAPEASNEALRVWKRLQQCNDGRPMRFIAWSWPSDKTRLRIRVDAGVKADRADAEAQFLAAFVNDLPPDAPVSFLGYSFGARIIAGSLHLLGGGSVDGRMLCNPVVEGRHPMRAVLVAGGVDNTTLLPGGRHSMAITQVEQLTVIFNPRDRVLRFYRVLAPNRSSEALGYTGLVGSSRLGDERWKLDQVNVASYVGKQHAWHAYLESGSIMRRIANDLFGAPIDRPSDPVVWSKTSGSSATATASR